MKEEMISIIVPVYNVESYLPRCVESILSQTYPNWQLILVDDGSKDNSPAICDEYAKKDDRIIALHQPNKGVSNARNHGLKKATGTYVTFIDADDFIHPQHLEKLHEGITIQPNVDMSMCGYRVCTDNDFDWSEETASGDWSIGPIHALPQQCKDSRDADSHPWLIWTKLYKRSLLPLEGFDETLTYGEDVSFLLDIVFEGKAKNVAFLDFRGYAYYMRPDSAMHKFPFVHSMPFAKHLSRYVKRYEDEELASSIYQFILAEFSTMRYTVAFWSDKTCYKYVDKLFKKAAWKAIRYKTIPWKKKIGFIGFALFPSLHRKFVIRQHGKEKVLEIEKNYRDGFEKIAIKKERK